MGWVIAIVVCFGVAWLLGKSIMKDHQKDKENGMIVSDLYATYVGGFADLEGGRGLHIKVYNDKVTMQSNKAVQVGNDMFTKVINMDNILNAEIKSEQQLQSDISLGNILTLGVFSLGKSKNVVQNYTIIRYKNSRDEMRDIVIQSQKNEQIVRAIRKLKVGEVD